LKLLVTQLTRIGDHQLDSKEKFLILQDLLAKYCLVLRIAKMLRIMEKTFEALKGANRFSETFKRTTVVKSTLSSLNFTLLEPSEKERILPKGLDEMAKYKRRRW